MTVNPGAFPRNWYFDAITRKEAFSMKTSRFVSRLLPGLVLWCGAASASTIIVATGVDLDRGGGLVIREDNVDTSTYFAGVISISLTQGNQTFNRDSLCVDLFTDIQLGQSYVTNVLRPDDVPQKNLERASWLVDNALLPVQDSTAASALASSDWVTSVAQGMGIQFAIWDIVHDGGDGFSAGRVQAASTTDANNGGVGATDAAALDWARKYEALSLGNSNNDAFVYNNVDMGQGVPAQMLIGPQFADGGPQPIPEPETLMPMGLGLIALSLGLRWGIRKRA
jgi:hypothetical protein